MQRVFIVLTIFAALVSATCAEDSPRDERRDVNVLLISLDTLRADHVHCWGYERETTPHLDKLAAEGVLFENATAASSWTVPSHMSVFTSLYPSIHGVEDPTKCLGDGVPTMAGILSKHGYATAAFVTGSSLNHAMGFDRGFGFYDDFSVELLNEANAIGAARDLDAEESDLNGVPTNYVITRLAADWLKKHGRRRFFLFLHFWDCHNDYIPPAPYDRRFALGYRGMENGRDIVRRREELERNAPPEIRERLQALYDGEIAHTDAHVGKVLAVLDELGLSDNTLVVVFSDHGEGFWEHGKILHGNGLGEELIHVPLIFRLPGVLPAGVRVEGNVSHVDVLPTVLGLLGCPKPAPLHGVDLSDVCRGKRETPNRPVFSELNYAGNVQRMARWGSYKLIEDRKEATRRLYVIEDGREIEASEAERNEDDSREAGFALTAVLNAGPSCAVAADRLAKPAHPDEKTLRRLRSLGYMQ